MKDTNSSSARHRSLVSRTLWRIETRLGSPLSLRALADIEGVTPFHLARAFTLSIGQSPMAYVKARRLSDAVYRLRDTDLQIVEIALDAGYESHEGFSRSFRQYFGCAPIEVRNTPELTLNLQEPIHMESVEKKALTPKFVTKPEERLVGVARRFTFETRAKIPQLWEEAIPEIGQAMFGTVTYGACYRFEDGAFTYLVGIRDDGRIDGENFDHVTLPAGEYAVFEHDDHISSIDQTWSAIFESWMPSAGVTATDGPEFEMYQADFDVEKPGGVSIWIPIADRA